MWTVGINCYVFIQMWLSKISGFVLFSELFRLREHGLRLTHISTLTAGIPKNAPLFSKLLLINGLYTYYNWYSTIVFLFGYLTLLSLPMTSVVSVNKGFLLGCENTFSKLLLESSHAHEAVLPKSPVFQSIFMGKLKHTNTLVTF